MLLSRLRQAIREPAAIPCDSVFTSKRSRPNRYLPTLEPLEDRCLLSADMVIRWNTVALDAVRADHGLNGPHAQAGPTRTSRALAIVQCPSGESHGGLVQRWQQVSAGCSA